MKGIDSFLVFWQFWKCMTRSWRCCLIQPKRQKKPWKHWCYEMCKDTWGQIHTSLRRRWSYIPAWHIPFLHLYTFWPNPTNFRVHVFTLDCHDIEWNLIKMTLVRTENAICSNKGKEMCNTFDRYVTKKILRIWDQFLTNQSIAPSSHVSGLWV